MPDRDDKMIALKRADFGFGTAEQDRVLWDTFVETDLWSSVFEDRIDVVLGAKGSGKSAIYSRLFAKSKELRRRGIELVGAENVADDPVFRELPKVPTLTGKQFVALWKLYFLTLIGSKLRELRLEDSKALTVVRTLEEADLLPKETAPGLVHIFQNVLRYVQFELELESGVDSVVPVGVSGGIHAKARIITHEPTDTQSKQGVVSVHDLLLFAGDALAKKRLTLWLLVDRLDMAFPSADDALESRALLSLLQTYVDLLVKRYRLSLKLFLRDDVWERIMRNPGDPVYGANAIRRRAIHWSDGALMNLLVWRVAYNSELCRLYAANADKLRKDARLREQLLSKILPPNQGLVDDALSTIKWILDQLRDGAGDVAPREVVGFLTFAREIQVERFSQQIDSASGQELFEFDTLVDAIRSVSGFRLFETLCLEYPSLCNPINLLRGGSIRQTTAELSRTWRRSPEDSRRLAEQLVSVGFFQRPPTDDRENTFYVAPLYRHALALRDRGLSK